MADELQEITRGVLERERNGQVGAQARDVPNAFDVIRMAVAPAHLARWITLLMSFALFVYAMRAATWGHLAIAATFTGMVHVPLWYGAWRERKR